MFKMAKIQNKYVEQKFEELLALSHNQAAIWSRSVEIEETVKNMPKTADSILHLIHLVFMAGFGTGLQELSKQLMPPEKIH